MLWIFCLNLHSDKSSVLCLGNADVTHVLLIIKYIVMEKKEMKYSEAIAELEGILAKMQSPNCDIDSLAALTSRSLELLRLCKDKLFKTDEEVRRCLETLSDSLG